MKVKVRIEGAQVSYDAYFDSYEDAQQFVAEQLQKCAVIDLQTCNKFDAIAERMEHYQREFANLDKMPYYCENENGVFINDFCNRASYEISLVKE